MAIDLDYVPLPAPVKDLVRATWQNELKDKSGQPLLKQPS
jgi:phosphate transport system substrate-binding protein